MKDPHSANLNDLDLDALPSGDLERILIELLWDGMCSNTRRLLYNRDPLWVRGLSFLVAPFGL